MLTVVIPAWNRQSTLGRTLNSVASQTLRPMKVVLVDNASHDATRAIMERWRDSVSAPDFKVTIVDEPRRGASDARNRGLACVDTPYVMFFDSDDEMLPTHCAEMLQTAIDRPDADIIGRPVRLSLLDGSVRQGRFTTGHPMLNHLFHGILSTQRYIVRTDLVRRVGGWNTELTAWVDWELGLRLLLSDPTIAIARGKPSVIVHSQPDSITGTGFSKNPAKWEKALESMRYEILKADRADLLPWIETRSIILAAKYHIEGNMEDARRLFNHTIKESRSPLRLRAIYRQHLLMRRGSAQFARILFPFTNSSKKTAAHLTTTGNSNVYPESKSLSIIVPAWNREKTLQRTLDSIAAQNYRPLTVILVDNRSSDDTYGIMSSWKTATETEDFRIHILSEPRRGASRARNRGLDAVDTDYALFFDSDDEMLPNHCSDLMNTAMKHRHAQIIGRKVKILMMNGTTRTGIYSCKSTLFRHIFHSSLSTVRYMVSTDLIRKVGKWNERSAAWEDWELGVRLLLAKPAMAVADGEPSVIVHSQPQSITGTCFSHSPAKWEDTLALIREDFTSSGRQDLMPWLDTRYMILAAKYHQEGAYSESRRLRNHTLSLTRHPKRMRLIYLQHRIAGRGTALFARMLFPRTPLD